MSKIKITGNKILSQLHFTLREYTLEFYRRDGTVQQHSREIFNKGNAATILPYNRERNTVILIRQFRLPVYLDGKDGGMLLEACAGIIEENETPEACILREAREETGYQIASVQHVFEAFMSPGSVTELVHFFVGEYTDDMKTAEGGGSDEEEDIEVLELPFEAAWEMMKAGKVRDAKTIMLLQHVRISNLLNT